MTDTEASEILTSIKNTPTIVWENGADIAFDLAIKALEERPKGEWIITGEEQGALGITYKIRKCNKCGWEHSLIIPDNFCSNCGAKMQKGAREK